MSLGESTREGLKVVTGMLGYPDLMGSCGRETEHAAHQQQRVALSRVDDGEASVAVECYRGLPDDGGSYPMLIFFGSRLQLQGKCNSKPGSSETDFGFSEFAGHCRYLTSSKMLYKYNFCLATDPAQLIIQCPCIINPT